MRSIQRYISCVLLLGAISARALCRYLSDAAFWQSSEPDGKKELDESQALALAAACKGREWPLSILTEAGVPNASLYCVGQFQQANGSILSGTRLALWKETSGLYGPEPVILKHQCNNHSKVLPFLLPQVSGLYNTGTNALVQFLFLNFQQMQRNWFPNRTTTTKSGKMRLPYTTAGKDHATARLNVDHEKHHPRDLYQVPLEGVKYLKVVIVRDPYWWMQSMCRSPYEVRWPKRCKCPNIFPLEALKSHGENDTRMTHPRMTTLRDMVRTTFATSGGGELGIYKSLADMWSTWYRNHVAEFLEQGEHSRSTPTLVIRFEDLLFHSARVLQAIADCAGMDFVSGALTTEEATSSTNHAGIKARYPLARSKAHGGGNPHEGFVHTVAKYGSPNGRIDPYSAEFLAYTKQALDPELMKLFQYKHALG